MKKILSITTALALLALATSVEAQTIITSIQFSNSNGTMLNSTAVAGVNAVADWNIGTLTGTPGNNAGNQVTNSGSSLITSTGAASGLSYTIASYGNKNATESMTTANPAGDSILMSNGAATRGLGSTSAVAPLPTSLALSGLNASHSYDFIVYIGTQGLLAGEYSLSLTNGATYYAMTSWGGNGQASLSTFTDQAATTDFEAGGGILDTAAAAYQSNYIEFSGYTGSSTANLTLTMLGNYPTAAAFVTAGTAGNIGCTVDIAGVQVIDETPEPSTYLLLGLGFAALVVVKRKQLLA